MDKMPEDLRWLAENVTEWAKPWPSYIPSTRLPLFAFVRNREVIYCQGGSSAYKANAIFSESDWQAARQQLEENRMDIVGTNGNDGLHYDSIMTEEEEAEFMAEEYRSKYHVQIRPGVWADVYDVLTAYTVTNPADAHAIKKMLCPGKRGHKPANQDRREAIVSLWRAIELEGES